VKLDLKVFKVKLDLRVKLDLKVFKVFKEFKGRQERTEHLL
jgi:hypothetical protein